MFNYQGATKNFLKFMESQGYEIHEGQKTYRYTSFYERNYALTKLFLVKDSIILDKPVRKEIENYFRKFNGDLPEYQLVRIIREVEHAIPYVSTEDIPSGEVKIRYDHEKDMRELIRNSEDDNFGFLKWVSHTTDYIRVNNR